MKVLAFGDSFVKMFIHCQPDVKHFKFKGKSIKGLAKDDDKDRKKIDKEIRKTPKGTKIMLFFGQVDFNYVRYFKVIHDEPALTEKMFSKYVEWVSSMNGKNNISIVSIFPSPIKKQYVVSSLVSKGSYTLQEQTQEIDNRILKEYDQSHQTWKQWNAWLQHYCLKYKVNNIKLFEKDHLNPQFYDLSNLTVHLRYVPVLKLVQKYVDIQFDAEKAEEIQKQYEKDKQNRITYSSFTLKQDQANKKFEKSCQNFDEPQKQEETMQITDASTQSFFESSNVTKENSSNVENMELNELSCFEIKIEQKQRKNTAYFEMQKQYQKCHIVKQSLKNVRSNSNEPTSEEHWKQNKKNTIGQKKIEDQNRHSNVAHNNKKNKDFKGQHQMTGELKNKHNNNNKKNNRFNNDKHEEKVKAKPKFVAKYPEKERQEKVCPKLIGEEDEGNKFFEFCKIK